MMRVCVALQITNDIDLYFLYTLDIGEHDFHNLKREQHIVVDFLGFPAKFIAMVELCFRHQQRQAERNSGGDSAVSRDHASHFVTKLNLTSGILSIVEVNEFNHVSHLNLQFRPGSDDSIKAYLSSSLKFATEAKTRLTRQGAELAGDLRGRQEQLEAVSNELRLLR
jgi:spindle assembly abnormal protein 6